MCPEQDSNLHVVKHTHLKRARLPIPPPGHTREHVSEVYLFQNFKERKTRLELATPTLARLCSTNWAISAMNISPNALLSGRQDSNLRPPGPKPGALPGCATPRCYPSWKPSFLNCECKDTAFFLFHKTFRYFFWYQDYFLMTSNESND